MSYTFQSVKDTEKLTGSSGLCHFIESFADYENQFALICGKIKALFGQPIYETENLENLFSYCILATSEEGEEVYLDAPSMLEFGIRDGVPYYNETELNLSGEEFRELCERVR